MRRFSLFSFLLLLGVLAFGQSKELVRETFGSGGFWQGAMNTNPNLVSIAEFSDDVARTQTWNASNGYDGASGGFHVILTDAIPSDTVRFSLNTMGFDQVTFAVGGFSWGGLKDQMEAAWSTDGTSWTLFDEDAITTGNLSGGGWTFVTFSETLPQVEALSVKFYRTAAQVHFDDIVVTGVPTSDNALLQSLEISEGSLDFNYGVTGYAVDLPYGTTETPSITAAAFADAAIVAVSDAADVSSADPADRTSTVEVIAGDGSTKLTYSVEFNVLPPRTNAALSGIGLSYATLAPDFSASRLEYLVDLPDTATVAPVITPALADASGASFVINPLSDLSSADRASRTATIVVTAQDGTTELSYEVVFMVGGGSDDLFLMDMETFGNEGTNYGVVLSSYSGFTSGFGWSDDEVVIRTSNPSAGYEGASGNSRIEMQAGWGSGYDTIVIQANTAAFRNVTLATGIFNNSGLDAGASIAFKAYYSTDSVNWTSIGTETQAGTAFPVAGSWSYVILDDVLPTDDSLYILFANQDANFEYYLDDITLLGTPLNTNNQLAGIDLSEGSLEPAFDPTVLEYVVDLPQGSDVTPTVTPSTLSPAAVVDQQDAADIRSLDLADNTTTIQVTAENGSVQTYEILFDVFMSSDDRLKELSVGDLLLAPAFDNEIMGYGVKLPAGTTEAPTITALAEDDFATVTVTPASDILSSDPVDRTAIVEVVAEDQVNSRTFSIVFTTGSLEDVRFNIMQEMFSGTGTYEVEDYPGYTSTAMFDGDEHKWDNANSSNYPIASGGSAIKFGDWAANPVFTELVMKQKIQGYQKLHLAFGMMHNSGGWGDGGCGLTNNFIQVEYTADSVNWVVMKLDSLTAWSMDWPCGGAPFSFIELAEELPLDDEGYVTVRITHTDGTIHPFYVDDLVLTGSPISTDASLQSLEVVSATLDPLFDPAVTTYHVELPVGTTAAPDLNYLLSSVGAGVDVQNAADVTSDLEADRTATLTVTAPDGVTTRVYQVIFTVAPNNDASLSGISVEGYTLDPGFDILTFDYTVLVPEGSTTAPAVTATPTDANAEVDVTPAADLSSASAADRTTIILVTAEDGTTTITYSVEFVIAVGIDASLAGGLELYPNPVDSRIWLRSEETVREVRITSMGGQVLKVHELYQGRETSMDVSALPAGLYLMEVITEDGARAYRSFVKN